MRKEGHTTQYTEDKKMYRKSQAKGRLMEAPGVTYFCSSIWVTTCQNMMSTTEMGHAMLSRTKTQKRGCPKGTSTAEMRIPAVQSCIQQVETSMPAATYV
jgi:hypothetical protein